MSLNVTYSASFSATQGESAQVVQWNIEDDPNSNFEGTYEVRLGQNGNFNRVKSGNWKEGDTVNYLLDEASLTAGVYSLRLVLTYENSSGLEVSNEYIVAVQIAPPSDTSRQEPTVPVIREKGVGSVEGSDVDVPYYQAKDTEAYWIVLDEFPDEYKIFLDGTEVKSGTWSSGDRIFYSLENLGIGAHILELEYQNDFTLKRDVTAVTIVDKDLTVYRIESQPVASFIENLLVDPRSLSAIEEILFIAETPESGSWESVSSYPGTTPPDGWKGPDILFSSGRKTTLDQIPVLRKYNTHQRIVSQNLTFPSDSEVQNALQTLLDQPVGSLDLASKKAYQTLKLARESSLDFVIEEDGPVWYWIFINGFVYEQDLISSTKNLTVPLCNGEYLIEIKFQSLANISTTRRIYRTIKGALALKINFGLVTDLTQSEIEEISPLNNNIDFIEVVFDEFVEDGNTKRLDDDYIITVNGENLINNKRNVGWFYPYLPVFGIGDRLRQSEPDLLGIGQYSESYPNAGTPPGPLTVTWNRTTNQVLQGQVRVGFWNGWQFFNIAPYKIKVVYESGAITTWREDSAFSYVQQGAEVSGSFPDNFKPGTELVDEEYFFEQTFVCEVGEISLGDNLIIQYNAGAFPLPISAAKAFFFRVGKAVGKVFSLAKALGSISFENQIDQTPFGVLAAWGYDEFGATNNITTDSILKTNSGDTFSVFIRVDGSLGEEGSSNATSILSDIPAGFDFTQVTGDDTRIARKTDGTLVLWGFGKEDNRPIYTDLPTNSFKDVSCLQVTGLGVKQDNSLFAWGQQVNQSTVIDDLPIGNDFIQAVVDRQSEEFAIALKNDNTAVIWGHRYPADPIPLSIKNGVESRSDIIQVDAFYRNAAVLTSSGRIFVYGDDTYGQVSGTPTTSDFKKFSLGQDWVLALKTDNSLVAWGYNNTNYNNVAGVPSTGYFLDVSAGRRRGTAIRNDFYV